MDVCLFVLVQATVFILILISTTSGFGTLEDVSFCIGVSEVRWKIRRSVAVVARNNRWGGGQQATQALNYSSVQDFWSDGGEW